jgi:putative DNA primase/helicase
MVARVDGLDGEFIGVHRTWLTRDAGGNWHRRNRASLGLVRAGAVRLSVPRPSAPLIIAEGIESTLAAAELTGWPGWAALSASGIKRLMLPSAVREAVIFVDRDRNGVGEQSARLAARRWVGEGRRVKLVIPHRLGTDANDLLREAHDAA